jgi:hypothetical protein
MAHPKINLGPERPEPEELVQQRERIRRLTGLSSAPAQQSPARSPAVPPVPNVVIETPAHQEEESISAPVPSSFADLMKRWMQAQPVVKVPVKMGKLSTTISAIYVHESDTQLLVFYDPALVDFGQGSTAMTVLDLNWEDRLEVVWKGKTLALLYAHAPVRLPGWPFSQISFFKTQT